MTAPTASVMASIASTAHSGLRSRPSGAAALPEITATRVTVTSCRIWVSVSCSSDAATDKASRCAACATSPSTSRNVRVNEAFLPRCRTARAWREWDARLVRNSRDAPDTADAALCSGSVRIGKSMRATPQRRSNAEKRSGARG